MLPGLTLPASLAGLPGALRLILPGKKARARGRKTAAPRPGTKVSAATELVTLLARYAGRWSIDP